MASTRTLPVEILCHIFSYTFGGETYGSQREFVRLGHICSEWRDAILSTPKLWSQFTLYISKSFDEILDLQLLLLYVNNSGNSPFRLDVHFRPFLKLLPVKTLNKIHEYVPKVHTLSIDGVCQWPMQDFPQFPMSWLSSVESLKLSSGVLCEPIKPRVLLNDFTHLRKLELKYFGIPRDVQLPWEQITSLKLDFWPIDLCMSLLVQCPNLVEFHALHSRWPKTLHIPQLSGHAHKLKHLSWGFDSRPICNLLSHQLRFPSLCTFHWHSPPQCTGLAEDEMGALRSLVSNFPPSISQLHLFHTEGWSDEFMEFVFVELKGLKSIHLSECTFSMVVQLLSLLNKMNDWAGSCILPVLAEIVIESVFLGYRFNEDSARMEDKIASHMVPLFHFRDPHKRRQFSLHIVQYDKTVSKGMCEAYFSLKKDGYAFKIWYRQNCCLEVPLPE